MSELYLWTVGYKVGSPSFVSEWKIKVITKTDSYGEAEKAAISIINKRQERANLKFLHITNIEPSKTVFAEDDLGVKENE